MYAAVYEFPMLWEGNKHPTHGMYYKIDMIAYWLDMDGELSFSDLYYGGNPSKERQL